MFGFVFKKHLMFTPTQGTESGFERPHPAGMHSTLLVPYVAQYPKCFLRGLGLGKTKKQTM